MAHVLILDDDPDLIEAIKGVLEDEGHTITMRVERALDDVVAVHPDLLLIDCPPGSDKVVLNFVQRIRLHAKISALPVVISTSSLRFVEPTLLHAKRIHVLVKPYTIDELVEAVRQLTGALET